MTRTELINIAKHYGGTHTVARMKPVLAQFKTVTEFLEASDGALMFKYNELHPNSKYGLGKNFFKMMESVRREAELSIKQEKIMEREQAHGEASDSAAEADPLATLVEDALPSDKLMAAKANPPSPPPPPSRFFTMKELRAIVTVMELAGIQEIDLLGIDEFFKYMKVDMSCLTNQEKSNG